MGEVVGREQIRQICQAERARGQRIVFTNGCFDLIHPGHVRSLRAARALGDLLVVGLNDDASVRRLNKGTGRPILKQDERAEVIAAFDMVDYVCLFPEDTPRALIEAVKPNVLVKGGDWSPETIVGADIVSAGGGTITAVDYHDGLSTSEIIRRIKNDID